jgi:hypothetical protein
MSFWSDPVGSISNTLSSSKGIGELALGALAVGTMNPELMGLDSLTAAPALGDSSAFLGAGAQYGTEGMLSGAAPQAAGYAADPESLINAGNYASQTTPTSFAPAAGDVASTGGGAPGQMALADNAAYENATAQNVAKASNPFSSLQSMASSAIQFAKDNPKTAMALGGAAGILALMKSGAFKANFMSPYQPQTAQQVGLGRTLSPQYQPVRPMAEGGITSLAVGGMPGQQYPMSQINYNGYNTPTQMPTSAMQMAGYQPSNTPLSGALEQNMASGGSTGITAAGESTGNGLNIYTPNTSNNSTGAQLAALASQYGVSLPTTMAAEGGIMALSSGGDPLAEMAAQRQNNAIDPRTGIPYSQEQYGNDSSFLGGLSQGINGLGQSISNGVSSVGKSLGFAEGGSAGNYNLGGYSDGGRLLKGPGDGMSDHIPASIADKQPARLADGEFVVPADVVSHLGNGSTDAGARHLYSMMDKVRKARTGNTKQGKQIQPEKYIPA